MPLSIPDYIAKTGIINTTPTYQWKGVDAHEFEVPRVGNKIMRLQTRSMLALSIGFGEWIFWRLSKKYTIQPELFLKFLEAAWAAVVDRRYMNYMTPKYNSYTLEHYRMSPKHVSFRDVYHGNINNDLDKDIEGSLLGLIMELGTIIDYTVPQNSNSVTVNYLSNIAETVTNEKIDEFKAWRRATIKRLTKFYPRTPEKDTWLGKPVPREAIDPDFDYHPSMAKDLINKYLSNLDWEANPFLIHPDELVKLGFKGTPYKYEG